MLNVGCSAFLVLLLLVSTATALAPHQVLLLVNENSPDSKRIAGHYRLLRDIPPERVVYLDVPDAALRPMAEVTYDEFVEHVYTPAADAAKKRKLEDQVLAWVYSVGFPTRIRASKTVVLSLQGATFLKGSAPPAPDVVNQGRYLSGFFRGPNGPEAPMAATATFDTLRTALGDELGLPSMMLGFTGSRGMTADEVIATLETGFSSDATAPSGSVFFVTNANVRSTCRAWQYPGAAELLTETPVKATIGRAWPKASQPLVGLMAGVQGVKTSRFREAFLPGALAEHLTSYAALFHVEGQTKATEWLRAGATASAGTVIEPYAVWTKFPGAHAYVHYVRGCSMIESLWLATYCPMQILFVGDPLATPWRPRFSVDLRLVESADQTLRFRTGVQRLDERFTPTITYYLDGRMLPPAGGDRLDIDTSTLAGGYHELRAVASLGGTVVFHEHDTRGFLVNRDEGRAVLRGLETGAILDPAQSVEVTVEASGDFREAGLLCDGREIAASRSGPLGQGSFDASRLSEGVHRLQAFATYRRQGRYMSAPVEVEIRRRGTGPQLGDISMEEEERGVLLRASGDPPLAWYELWDPADETRPHAVASGRIELKPNRFTLVHDGRAPYATCILGDADFEGDRVACRTTVVNTVAGYNPGLVFGFRRPGDFGYFGIWGDHSAVVMGEYREGKRYRHVVRGYPFRPGTWYELSVRRTEDGFSEGYVNGAEVASWKHPSDRWTGRVGLLSAKHPGVFRDVALGLPVSGEDQVAVRSSGVFVGHPDAARGRTYVVRAGDGYVTQEKRIVLGDGDPSAGREDPPPRSGESG